MVVGGYAASFHAQPRATEDLEVFIAANLDNARRTYEALGSFGAPLESISPEDLADPKKFIRFGREPLAIDILPGIDGVEFREAWGRRVDGIIDESSGLSVHFISKTDLIASKIAAGRPRDLADVDEIRNADESLVKLPLT